MVPRTASNSSSTTDTFFTADWTKSGRRSREREKERKEERESREQRKLASEKKERGREKLKWLGWPVSW